MRRGEKGVVHWNMEVENVSLRAQKKGTKSWKKTKISGRLGWKERREGANRWEPRKNFYEGVAGNTRGLVLGKNQ